jgi:hypothetical protein
MSSFLSCVLEGHGVLDERGFFGTLLPDAELADAGALGGA